MRYNDLTDEPGKADEVSVDAFVDWYAGQLKLDAIMADRPDRRSHGTIDGEYQIGTLRMAVEHTSIDEVIEARRIAKMASSVRHKLSIWTPPNKDYSYTLSVPESMLHNEKAAVNAAGEISNWLSSSAVKVRGDGRPRIMRLASGKAYMSARKTYFGRGKLYLVPTTMKTHNQIKSRRQSVIVDQLERKLPKLLNYRDDENLLRVLVIENNEVSWACKSDYAAHVRGHLHRHNKNTPDEIWAMEYIGGEVDPTLLWCRQLDGTTRRNPFNLNDGRSLGQAEYERLVTWAMLRAPQAYANAAALSLHAKLATMLADGEYIERVYGALLAAKSWP